MNDLTIQEYSILSTVAFFDIFNYPLTLFEAWKWVYRNSFSTRPDKIGTRSKDSYTSSEVESILRAKRSGVEKFNITNIQDILESSEDLKQIINTKNGFYFLRGREELVARRRDLYRDAEARWKKLRRVANILQYVPNVKMVAACNTLPINDFKPESDIDAFIIIKKNRLWLTRFLITALVSLMGEWRHKKRIAGKICLSFYITNDALNLEPIAKKPYDIYLAYWIAMVAPLYKNQKSKIKNQNYKSKTKNDENQKDIYQQFLQANSWVKNYLPNFIGYAPVEFERKVGESKFLQSIKKIKETILDTRFGDWLENFFRKIQKNKMAKNYQSAVHGSRSDVIISDQMLKFHEIDRRFEFRQKFELRLAKILESVKKS